MGGRYALTPEDLVSRQMITIEFLYHGEITAMTRCHVSDLASVLASPSPEVRWDKVYVVKD